VAVLSRTSERAEELAAHIGPTALPLAVDVRDEVAVESAREAVVDRFGRVDVLVTFAGGNVPAATRGPDDAVLDFSLDGIRDAFELNLTGTLVPVRAFGPAMVAGEPLPGGASIVTVASVGAHRPLSRVAAYSAAKAAVVSMTRSLAVELGHAHGDRIRVNALVPGFFTSEQNRSLLLRPDGEPTDRGRAVLAHTPLGRLGHPNELVGALVWLAGPGSGFVTGSTVVVDGGFTAQAGV
jgi:NAD(P)-dependent dehydrogenase (short-subunit alcohol dehydrogenase family)